MSAYDFRSLSPIDFEELVRDLLQAEMGIRLESFAAGRDRGIDLRYARAVDRPSLIVQCKHYHQSGFSALKREIKREEVPKIARLAPVRYLLSTSVALTPGRKEQLIELLTPFCTDPSDILGLEDLNNLLGRNPAVERRHHKLWLTSEATLHRVLHHPTFLQAEFERDSIRRRLSLYVETSAFDRATRILNEHNYCIISGIPGIGKTTLAEILILHLIEAGFDLVVATSSLQEALRLFRAESSQVIYYDDFLGRSSLGEKLEKNEDRILLKLLKEARGRPSKKLILTTREYILAQARHSYELLRDTAVELGKCVVQLDDYSRYERARILYNHLFFFDVPRRYIDALLEDRRYLRVIDHPHFSPRIVQWMTEMMPIEQITPRDYAEEFLANLQNPERLWAHAFDNDLDADARHILLILGCMPQPCLLNAVQKACAFANAGVPGETNRRFERAVRQIDGTFVRTFRSRAGQGTLLMDFHNPSISDFILRRLGSDQALCASLLECAAYFEQLETLMRLKEDGTGGNEARGMIQDSSIIGESIRRLLRTEAVGAERVGSGDRYWWSPRSVSIGRRLERASNWATALESPALHRVVIELVESIVTEGGLEGLNAEALAGILTAYHQSSEPLGVGDAQVRAKIIAAAIAELDRLGTVDEWREWTSALDALGDNVLPEQHQQLEQLVQEFCRGEPQQILSEADSEDQARGWMDELLGVAESWEVDLSSEVAAFEASLSENFSPEPEGDYEMDSWDRGEDRGDGAAIERLFDSLRRG